MYKMHSRNFKTPKIKNMRRHRNNELRGTLNKHQSKTKNTINRHINELKKKIKNIKDKVNKDVENLRKKNQTQTQNTVEEPSSRLEQVQDRIIELKDKIEIKGKTKEMLVKQLKSCERNMQEFTNSIKRPNLRILISTSKNPCSFLLLLIFSLQQN
jgi:chromosome segregation ATPase